MPSVTVSAKDMPSMGMTVSPEHKYWKPNISKTGCDEVAAAVRKALQDAGIVASVFFEKFEHR